MCDCTVKNVCELESAPKNVPGFTWNDLSELDYAEGFARAIQRLSFKTTRPYSKVIGHIKYNK